MARRRASIVTLLALIAVMLGASATGALADGDPASDILLGQNVFYPYQPAVPAAVQNRLNGITGAAGKAGFPIKVALIARPLDLGVIPGLFGKPQKYADFLDQEISFQGKQPLLVVMADGYGSQALPAAATAAVPSLKAPTGTTPTALAEAAATAVARLAAADGHPIKDASGSGSSGSSSAVLIIPVALAALLVAGAVLFVRRRQAVDTGA